MIELITIILCFSACEVVTGVFNCVTCTESLCTSCGGGFYIYDDTCRGKRRAIANY